MASPHLLMALLLAVASVSAFVATPAKLPVRGVRAAAAVGVRLQEDASEPEAEVITPPKGWTEVKEDIWAADKQADIRIEGGETLKTFAMPATAERVQYILKSLAAARSRRAWSCGLDRSAACTS